MRVLLIGGNGFIGPAVIAGLRQRGHEVTIFHRGTQKRSGVEAGHILGDRNDLPRYAEAFRKLAPEVVIDFILSSGRQARELVETFKGIARRVIALSSADVYRACGILHGLEERPLQAVPLTEESGLRTTGQTYSAEALARVKTIFNWIDAEYDKIPVERAIMAEPQLPGTILRLPMVYGPGDPLHRLFPLVKRIDDGKKVILLDEQVAQWRGPRGYVENVGTAIVAAATSERAAGRIYNVAQPQNFSELEWTRKVASVAGFTGEIRVVPSDVAPAHIKIPGNLQQHWSVDSSRIRQELEYKETVELDETIRRTIAWERENPPVQVDERQFDYAAEDGAVSS